VDSDKLNVQLNLASPGENALNIWFRECWKIYWKLRPEYREKLFFMQVNLPQQRI